MALQWDPVDNISLFCSSIAFDQDKGEPAKGEIRLTAYNLIDLSKAKSAAASGVIGEEAFIRLIPKDSSQESMDLCTVKSLAEEYQESALV